MEYGKAAEIRDGLILNFGTMPLTIKRIGPGRPSPDCVTSSATAAADSCLIS